MCEVLSSILIKKDLVKVNTVSGDIDKENVKKNMVYVCVYHTTHVYIILLYLFLRVLDDRI